MMNKTEQPVTVNEMLKNGKYLDYEILDTIYGNPIIRDLPKLAALYGLYGRFIVAQERFFFVYGNNKDVVFGKFYETMDTIIPEKTVNKCGYFNYKKDADELVCLNCQVMEIGTHFKAQRYYMNEIIRGFLNVERLCRLYEKYDLKIPEYAYSSTNIRRQFNTLQEVTENPSVEEGPFKMSYREREKQLLKDIAIYDWPIRPDGEKPGFLAFMVSRYFKGGTDPRVTEKLYRAPEKWNNLYKGTEMQGALALIPLTEIEADFVTDGFEKLKIPYRITKYDWRVTRSEEKEEALLDRLLPGREKAKKSIPFNIHKSDFGALVHLTEKLNDTKFSDEEKFYGRLLYYGTVEEKKQNGIENPEAASYLFHVSHAYIDDFKRFAKENNIMYGYINDGWIRTPVMDGAFLITPLSNMPIVERFLHRIKYINASVHECSVDRNTSNENRYIAKERDAVYITSYLNSHPINWRYPRKKLVEAKFMKPDQYLKRTYIP